MSKYCVHCGAKLGDNMRFCHNCGKPCERTLNRRPPARSNNAVRQSSSSGVLKFIAGTAVGAFFMNLFGSSPTASASTSTHTETVEHFHDTVVYNREREDEYDAYDEYDEYDSDCEDEWGEDAGEYEDDGYDDYADGGYDDGDDYDDDE
ncbi:MAG: zinc ribbon domain-containing protein [Selenomonadaceae bacterium]|nr:zinc ribbon domain-containing protein [Selenomonadaceae bacterium]